MNTILKHSRVALRQHLRQPGFAMTVVLTLGLTTGATTAVFSVVNGVLVRALPYSSPDRLAWIASVRPDNPNAPFSLPEFMDYRSQTRTLSGLAGYANWTASVAGDGITQRFQGARMSANAFDVLGVSPAAGRLLNDSDDRADAPPVAVVSYRVWQRQYGGKADVIGKTARINGASFEIVGVLPVQFPLPLRDIDVVIPLTPDRDPVRHVRNSVNFLRVFGRLASGRSADQAQAELQAICRSLRERFPVEYARKEAVRVDALHEVLVGDFRQSMLILLGAVIVVLGTALANLVSLALVRANNRRAELTIRTAVGASRPQLARQLAAEALLLAAVGSLLGIVVATQAISVATVWAPPSIPRLAEVSIDRSVALFVIGITVLVTALLTAAPLGAVARTRAGDALRLSSRGAIGDRWNHRIRAAMVVGEIATALVLLLSTVVLVQNVLRLQELHLGFNPDSVFQARVSIPPTYRSPDDLGRFYDRLSERLTGAPGVAHLGVISVAPLSGLLATAPFSVAGQSTADRDRPSANVRAISPGYLSTVDTKLLQGRSFAETDRSNTPHVALVSNALADRFLSGAAVGQHLLINDNNQGPRPVEIVGVVENVRHIGLDQPPALDIYIPLPQVHQDFLSRVRENQYWMVRTESDPGAFGATFLAHLRAVDPDAAVADTGAMRQLLDAWLGPRRFNLGLFGSFALTAVLLAIVGLHGLVSYTVSQRTPEIGLRMAMGATQGNVQRMILGQAAWLGSAGAIGGIGIALSARPFIGRVMRDVGIDPITLLITVVLLLGVVLLAAWLPARRAARIEPSSALRTH
jgi:putative ABC transport system permease protein